MLLLFHVCPGNGGSGLVGARMSYHHGSRVQGPALGAQRPRTCRRIGPCRGAVALLARSDTHQPKRGLTPPPSPSPFTAIGNIGEQQPGHRRKSGWHVPRVNRPIPSLLPPRRCGHPGLVRASGWWPWGPVPRRCTLQAPAVPRIVTPLREGRTRRQSSQRSPQPLERHRLAA